MGHFQLFILVLKQMFCTGCHYCEISGLLKIRKHFHAHCSPKQDLSEKKNAFFPSLFCFFCKITKFDIIKL